MTPHANRIRELDALRGLAALAVVAFHYTTRYDELFGHAPGLAFWASWGGAGVELFFMLSGFVIFMTLDRTRGAMDFVAGRFSRLYPAYWAAVAATFAVARLADLAGQQTTFAEAAVNLTMLQGLFKVRHVDGAYWSLQAELLFYAAMLALHRAGALRHLHATLAIWLGAAFAVAAWPASGLASGLAESVAPKLQTLFSLRYIQSFAVGMLLYDMRREVERPATRRWLAASGLFAASLAFRTVEDSWQGLVRTALLAALLAAAVNGRLHWLRWPGSSRGLLTSRPLAFLGAISYSLYLIHQNIGYVAIRELTAMGVGPNLAVSLAAGLAICLAALLSRHVEQPAMAWMKDRYRRFCMPAATGAALAGAK